MPNHVYNAMVIRGTPEELDTLWAKLNPQPEKDGSSGELTCELFQSLEPMPEEYNGTTADFGKTKYPELMAKYGANNWYDWCNQNWGTKWGDYDTTISREDGYIFLTFTTAWSCPVNFYQEHLKNFKLRANEEGTESLTKADHFSVMDIRNTEEFLLKWAKDQQLDIEDYKRENGEIDFYTLSLKWTMAVRDAE